MAHFSQKLSMWLAEMAAEKSCDQGRRQPKVDTFVSAMFVMCWQQRLDRPLQALPALLLYTSSSAQRIYLSQRTALNMRRRGHFRTAQFNYSQLKRWSRCQLMALIWKINHAVAWWNMLDLITGRGEDPPRETDTEGTLNMINNSDSHGVCNHRIMKKVPKVHH